MKPGLTPGQRFEFSVQVTDAMKAKFQDGVVHNLYSTASMITHMEWAARQHILPYLEPGEEGVGYHVDVKHLAPTPMGAVVRIQSTVIDVQPNRVTSRVEAWQQGPDLKIGDGTFVQAIVPLEKLHGQATVIGNVLPEPENEPAETRTDVPPPAVLQSADGSARFSFEVLAWENPFPCTRYDEWLICLATLTSPSVGQNTQQGPFLLRYEIEEWMEGIEKLLKSDQADYQSDFLEPRLRFTISPSGDQAFVLSLKLSDHHQPGEKRAARQVEETMTITPEALQQFLQQMSLQMEGFYSKI